MVLSSVECLRLFDAMDGTNRLMEEVMYAAGLRLTELLRLRVKDVDLERLQLAVQCSKGKKSRVTMIPPSLWNHCERIASGCESCTSRTVKPVCLAWNCHERWSTNGPSQMRNLPGSGFGPRVI
jgi:integrase